MSNPLEKRAAAGIESTPTEPDMPLPRPGAPASQDERDTDPAVRLPSSAQLAAAGGREDPTPSSPPFNPAGLAPPGPPESEVAGVINAQHRPPPLLETQRPTELVRLPSLGHTARLPWFLLGVAVGALATILLMLLVMKAR